MADQLPLSGFIRPNVNKSIRIKNPDTGEQVLIPSPQKPVWPSTIYTRQSVADDAATAERAKKLMPKELLKEVRNVAVAQAAALERERKLHNSNPRQPQSDSHSQSNHTLQVSPHSVAVNENFRSSLDIYARAFVPDSLRVINMLDGYTFETLAMKPIDFGLYTRTFIGLGILPPMPFPMKLPSGVSLGQITSVSPSQYEFYFRHQLEDELQAQHQENEEYSLFGCEVNICIHPLGQVHPSCFFTVPGLRENNPYVEEDDIVQLRQIRYDETGMPFGMDRWLPRYKQLENIGRVPSLVPALGPAPGWTGLIYNGRIEAVRRKQEEVVLRISGYQAKHLNFASQNLSSEIHKARFNIKFPVPEKRYIPMWQALAIVQESLSTADVSATIGPDRPSIHYPGPDIHVPSPPNPNEIFKTSRVEQPRPWLQSILFPDEQDCQVQENLNPGQINRPFSDRNLNWEQKKAIQSVCTHNYGTLPFLISGPPGTGKTKTLVELAVQLIKHVDKVSHILICAPSDPAADTIVERIRSHFKVSELLRLNRPARTFAEVSGAVLPFCHMSERENKFDLPPFKQLLSYKLVVTTCRDAALLLYARLTNKDLFTAEYGLRSSIHPFADQPSQVELHWTALLIDESAQAMEPEVLIPLCVITPPASVNLAFTPLFVMAGDECQLGPRTSLRSSPLKTSLLARLFARPVYYEHPLARRRTGIAPPPLNREMLPINRPAFVNLIRNYRSHPAILAIPSALFYADTLEPEAKDTDRLAGWSEWKGRRWPVLFHNNLSEDDIEIEGGGWFNKGEARVACSYAASLVKTGLVTAEEVCIMTPFKAQVQCLRNMIREAQYGSHWDINIGPTEAFQGLERGVVILCTTRSKERFVNSDAKLDWGIIGLPNKMNVALTRAKFGLIVIGKQDVLAQDPNWSAFLRFCFRNGLVTDTPGNDNQDKGEKAEPPTRLEKVLMANERDLREPRFWGNGQDDEMWTTSMEGMNISDEEYEDDDSDNDSDNDNDNDAQDHDDEEEENQEENVGSVPENGTRGFFP